RFASIARLPCLREQESCRPRIGTMLVSDMAHPSIAANDVKRDPADVRRRIKAIFVGSIANLVEWYDFYAYAAFALYFASSFFPGTDPVVQQLNAAILFAFGFIVRTIGRRLF